MEATDPLVGRVIAGKLRLLSLLGAGACGKVFRAHHEGLDKTVAIKVLHRAEIGGANLAARFKAEARAASRLDHPNSMRILDFGEDGEDGLLYIAMEFLDGEDLGTVMANAAPLAPGFIAAVMSQALAALAVAHQQGVIHRDMKPGNIMLLPLPDDQGVLKDVVKVCDFGLAKLLDGDLTDSNGAPLTTQGSILGTPMYMSPEQASGEKTDGLTDVYACGVIIYQMLTGQVPFTGDSATAVLIKHIAQAPTPILSLAPEADPRLAAIAHKAMEKRKEDRFGSAREMLTALREVERSTPTPTPALSRSAALRGASAGAPPATQGAFAATFVRDAGGPTPAAKQSLNMAVAQSEVERPRTLGNAERPRTFADAPPSVALPPPAQSQWMLVSVFVGSLALLAAGGVVALVLLADDEAVIETPGTPTSPAKPSAAPATPPSSLPTTTIDTQPVGPRPEGTAPIEAQAPGAEPGRGKPRGEKKKPDAPVPATPLGDVAEKVAVPSASPPPPEPTAAPRREPPAVVEAAPSPDVAPKPAPVIHDVKGEDEPTSVVKALSRVHSNLVGVAVTGGLSTTRASRTLDHLRPELLRCLESTHLKTGSARQGVVKVSARVNQDGRLEKVDATGDAGAAAPCIIRAVKSSPRFEIPTTGEAGVTFRIDYRVE